nr:AMP-binding protein [Thermoleophilaceae bacterium]
RGATALLHDGRFDAEERLDIVEREGVGVLCMAPTEYRTIAKRGQLRSLPSVRHAVAAGEALNPEVIGLWEDQAGVAVHDGYGQTETGALTGMPIGEPLRRGSMGRALPGFRVWVHNGELCADPATVPTFFLDGGPGPWRTGDRVREDAEGYLWFEGRTDDVIISAGYRIGPFEVESALVSHPAVAEAAAVAAPDDERGQVVRAVVVLQEGAAAGPALARELQDHVKRQTAPYKYPRIVDFAAELPKTASGKIRRVELRQ